MINFRIAKSSGGSKNWSPPPSPQELIEIIDDLITKAPSEWVAQEFRRVQQKIISTNL